jgi:hypothetical protein
MAGDDAATSLSYVRPFACITIYFIDSCRIVVFWLSRKLLKNRVCGLKSNFYICVLEKISYFVHCWTVEEEFDPSFRLG